MKNTDSRKKITIEVNEEKITASKGFFCDYAMLLYMASDREREKGFETYANALNDKAFNIYSVLKDSGYFDGIK